MHPLLRKSGSVDGGEGKGDRGRQALCAPYLRAKGAAAVNAGEGRSGWATYPGAPLCAMQGRQPVTDEGGEYIRGGEGKGGKRGGRVVLDPVAEAKRTPGPRACALHVQRVSPPPHPRHPPISATVPICVERRKRPGLRPSPASHTAPFVLRQGTLGEMHEGLLPPSLSPVRATPFAQKGGVRGHLFPLSRPLSFPHIPPSLSFAPSPSPVRTPIRTEGCMRAPTTTLSLSSRPLPLHSCEGTPPLPFPICAEGRSTRVCRPVRAGRVYARSHHPWPPPYLAAPFARQGGTRGHAVPPFRIRTTGATAFRPLPIWPRRPICEGTPPPAPPFPLATPRGTHGKTRGQAMPASPRVAQQGRRGLHASVFTAPAPRFRAP
ncbi:hypothetical protein EDB83DRAFT_2316084 [Lactarius deliciosus]|nr:hypothetical protein EDB83DRAFT_2316084 [Lactarius deliciosus]